MGKETPTEVSLITQYLNFSRCDVSPINPMEAKTKAALLIAALAVAIILPIYLISQATTSQIETSPNLTVTPSNINWGTLHPNQQATQTVTLSNTGDKETQPLTMMNDCSVGILNWNLEGIALYPRQNVIAEFTLTVSPNASKSAFSFSITVTG